MKGRWAKYLLGGVIIALLVGCESRPTDRGQQYKNGKLAHPFELVNNPNAKHKPVNGQDFARQVSEISQVSPALYNKYRATYQAIFQWMIAGAEGSQLTQFNLDAYQMEGVDNYGNVQFTGYYTPVIHARHTRQGEFQYPLYAMPNKSKKMRSLPDRARIYAGALDGQNLELAYSNSLVDNFMMEVQGSAFVDFEDGSPMVFFAYAGKNGRGYTSIGKILIDRNEVAREDMSMQAIKTWTQQHSTDEVRELLEQNASFVFFKPRHAEPVKGASAVPLIAKASVASDKLLIPAGTTILAEVPLLDNQGKFTGKYEMRLMVALDVGGAIKGHHFDIYQGIGDEAGHAAGFYNHYGRVWVLSAPSDLPMVTN
jgi:membrane-bound lytic murein transglycosylase A